MDNKDLTSIDFFNKKIKKNRQKQQDLKRKRFKNISLTIIITITVVFIYLTSPIAKIAIINVSGTNYLDKNDIIKQSQLTNHDYLFLSWPQAITNRLLKHQLIAEAKVSLNFLKGQVNLEIKEKELFGYRYDSDEPEIILANHEILALNQDNLKLLPYLIYISGFNEENLLDRLLEGFQAVDDGVKAHISEIFQYQVSYDDSLIRIVLKDGNQVFTSFQTIAVLNYYFEIVKSLKVANACIFIDELSQQPYTSQCPTFFINE